MCNFKNLKKYFSDYFIFSLIFTLAILFIIQYFFPQVLDSMWGTFFGAVFAFILNYVYKAHRTKKENCQTLIKEHFKLQIFYKELAQIKTHVEDCKKKSLETKEQFGISEENWKLLEWQFVKRYLFESYYPPFSEGYLDFMLEKKALEYLKGILLANEQYRQVLFILQKRDEIYENYLLKTTSGEKLQEIFSFETLEKKIGQKLAMENIDINELLSKKLTDSIKDVENAVTNTSRFIKNTWNKEPLIL